MSPTAGTWGTRIGLDFQIGATRPWGALLSRIGNDVHLAGRGSVVGNDGEDGRSLNPHLEKNEIWGTRLFDEWRFGPPAVEIELVGGCHYGDSPHSSQRRA